MVLEPEEGVPDSDYINASYVDVSHPYFFCTLLITFCWKLTNFPQSLVQPKAYIVTQGPTESTMPDFWRMVWQEKASCIVMVTRTFDFIRVM